jgi:hypothetical protein
MCLEILIKLRQSIFFLVRLQMKYVEIWVLVESSDFLRPLLILPVR